MYKMPDKVYLYLFILCTILSQGIFGTFLEDDIGESSDLHVRNKRVINRIPGEDVPMPIQTFSYIARIRRNNRLVCVGTILSPRTVITAARCFTPNELPLYTVSAGSAISNKGKIYNITGIELHGHHPPRSQIFMTGIALATVDPPIVYSIYIGSIGLHAGPVVAGTQGVIAGWGTFYHNGTVQTEHPRNLRVIVVPIINHQECVNMYRHFFDITEQDICTHHEHKQCGVTDTGAPLVVNNSLVGIYMGVVSTIIRNCHLKPDVFALVQHREYSNWIRANIVN